MKIYNILILKDMKALIILIILLGFSILNSFSQENTGNTNLIYHDYIPDLRLNPSSDTMKIDINQDNIPDIGIYFYNRSDGGIFLVESLNKNCQYANIYLSSGNSTDSLTRNSLRWGTESSNCFEIECHGKIGLKFTLNDSTYYGWIKGAQTWMGDAENRRTWFTIENYAFCTIANYPLLWGQTEIITGNNPINSNNNIKFFVNGTGDSIVVQSDKIIKTIKLLNLSGVVIKTWEKVQSMNATLSTTGLTHGAYLVQVTYSGNKVFTEKIVL
jgi:hypothetical protein